MNKILFLLLLCVTQVDAQFATIIKKNTVPAFIVAGQSNGENFTSSYQTATKYSQQLADSLEVFWGVPEVIPFSNSAAGKGLDTFATDLDFNMRVIGSSYGEVYRNFFTQWASDTVVSSLNKYPGVLLAQGKEVQVKFVVWLQGERDASENKGSAERYGLNLTDLIAKYRRDYNNPTMPFIIVKLHPGVNRPPDKLAIIRTAMQNIADADPFTYAVEVSDLSVPVDWYDNIHYSDVGLPKLRNRILSTLKTISW